MATFSTSRTTTALLPRLLAAALVVFAFPLSAHVCQADPVVLMYHRFEVSESKASTVISRSDFAEQMAYLKGKEIPVISAGELVDLLEKKSPLPEHAVVVTIDDGWHTGTYAKQVLNQYEFPYLMALYTEVLKVRVRLYLSPAEVKGLKDDPTCIIANHSFSHSAAIMYGRRGSASDDIKKAQAYLIATTGKAPEFFVYPYGIITPHLRQTVIDQGFRAAFSTDERPVRVGDDLWTLPRYNVSSSKEFHAALAAMDLAPRAHTQSKKLPLHPTKERHDN